MALSTIGYNGTGAGQTTANGNYVPVTGANATVNGATQYTNGADFLGYSPTGPSGAMWQITSAVNGGGAFIYFVTGTPATMPLTGWGPSSPYTPPIFTVLSSVPSASAPRIRPRVVVF